MNVRERIAYAGIVAAARAAYAWERLRHGVGFDMLGWSYRTDPYPAYARLREVDPVHRSGLVPGWVLSRYDDVLAALGDARLSADERNWKRYRFIAAGRRRMGLPEPYADGGASMLRLDPPDHTRLRRLVSKAFTPRSVEQMRGRIEAIAEGLLARFGERDRDRIELVRDFAAPLPVIVIAEMLGIPPEDHERFRHWSDEGVRTIGFGSSDDVRRSFAAQQELRAYLEGIFAARRREPRDDLVSALVAAEETGDRLTTEELFAQTMLILIAGNETTTNLIGNGLVALLRHPDQLEILRRDPERIPAAIDELLRYDSPVQLTSRMAPVDLEFRGRRVRRGEQLVLLLGAANRDPAVFPEPDRLDVTREDVRPLSLGHGIHFCLGAQLARLEGEVAFRTLLAAFSQLRLVHDRIEWGDNTILRGPRRLELEVARHPRAAARPRPATATA
jgi:cytochrome P450